MTAQRDKPNIEHPSPAQVRKTFRQLADSWRAETATSCSMIDIVTSSSYQSIIGLGREAVPLIREELQARPDHWAWALTAITRENPVADEDAGSDLDKMTDAWLEWGKARGLLA